jgi:hypothetical protein
VRDRSNCVLRVKRGGRDADEDIDLECHELRYHAPKVLGNFVRKAVDEPDVLTIEVSKVFKFLEQRSKEWSLSLRAAGMPQHADRGDSARSLGVRRNWPYRRTEQSRVMNSRRLMRSRYSHRSGRQHHQQGEYASTEPFLIGSAAALGGAAARIELHDSRPAGLMLNACAQLRRELVAEGRLGDRNDERARQAQPSESRGDRLAVALTCPSEPSVEEGVLPDAIARLRIDYLPSGGCRAFRCPQAPWHEIAEDCR